MTREFDNPRWEKSRLDRAQRMEIEAARRLVSAGFVERVGKQGKWVVFKDGETVVTEVFGVQE